MARQRIQLQPCFILHRRDYRNSSLLLEVFSEEHGRLCLVGKGVRRERNKMRPYLQVFSPLHMSWVIAGDMGQLTMVEPSSLAIPLQRRGLFSAFYINELLLRLLGRHDPHPQIFHDYHNCLHALLDQQMLETALRLFEKKLLVELGYGLTLDRDQDGTLIDAQQNYVYLVERGPVLLDKLTNKSEAVRIKGQSLLSLHSEQLPTHDKGMVEIKTLMRYVLRHYLGRGELKSRVLFTHRAEF